MNTDVDLLTSAHHEDRVATRSVCALLLQFVVLFFWYSMFNDTAYCAANYTVMFTALPVNYLLKNKLSTVSILLRVQRLKW